VANSKTTTERTFNMKGKKLIDEFKEFINRGNVMDMAVGVIVGAAFTSIVNSLVDDIINPLITLITGGNGTEVSGLKIAAGGGEYIDFGAFISAIINFLIIALCVFFIVKAINKMKDGGLPFKKNAKGEETIEHAPKCPFCLEEVNEGATRCHHCAAELPEKAVKTVEVVTK
jgi:large conductance mechanosensitive channel